MMRNLIYFMGIASFLACMIFTVTTSLTNPFYGMSESAVAQATTYTTTSDSTSTLIVHKPETNKYIVRRPDSITLSNITAGPSNTYGGSIGAKYNGIGAEGSIIYSGRQNTTSVTVTYNDPTICNYGGNNSCFKSSKGETLFNVYY